MQTVLGYLQKLTESFFLLLWNLLAEACVRLINVLENTTYPFEAPHDYKAVLRIHRENYHSLSAIESELAWLKALGFDSVIKTPGYYLGRDECAIESGKLTHWSTHAL